MDKRIFDIIFNTAQNNPMLLKSAEIVNRYSKRLYCFIYFLVTCNLFASSNVMGAYYIGAPAAALLLNYLLKNLIKRPRPEIPGIKKSSFSFPSNHSLSSGVIALSTCFIYPKLGLFLLILSIITAMARIMEGFHFPSDALGGLLLGYGISYLSFLLYTAII